MPIRSDFVRDPAPVCPLVFLNLFQTQMAAQSTLIVSDMPQQISAGCPPSLLSLTGS